MEVNYALKFTQFAQTRIKVVLEVGYNRFYHVGNFKPCGTGG